MTSLNFTFQEASPLIFYSGTWAEDEPAQDPSWMDYNGSARATLAPQSAATLTFLGTGVSLFGATRPNHGNYTVVLDQQPMFTASGFTFDNEFNKSLWHANDLPYAEHTVTLSNVPVGNLAYLDLDFVSIERLLGQPGDTIYELTLDDTSPFISFVGTWEASSGVSSAYQGTLHTTQTANAQVFFSFQGCSIELYGQYVNAPYTVVLDNEPAAIFQALYINLTPNFQHPQTLLYLADGLLENYTHTVTITNSNSNQNQPFFFDYAIIRSTQNFTNMTNGTVVAPDGQTIVPTITDIPNSQSSAGASNSTPVGAIVGGTLGLVAVIGIGVLLCLMGRRRQRAGTYNLDLVDNEPKPNLHTGVSFNGEPHQEPQALDQPLPVAPPASVRNAPSSVFRPASVSYRVTQGTSSDGLISAQERSESSRTRSHAHTTSSTTFLSTSRSAPEPSQPASLSTPLRRSTSPSRRDSTSPSRRDTTSPSRRDTTSPSRRDTTSPSRRDTTSPSRRDTTMTRSSVSQSRADGSRGQPVYEEDAGLLIDLADASDSQTLPPAYNPAWGQGL